MKFSYGTAAIVAPTLVLSAAIGFVAPRFGVIDPVPHPIELAPMDENPRGPSLWRPLRPFTGPGPVVTWEHDSPIATEKDMTPAGAVNMPGPVIGTDELFEVLGSVSEDRSEEAEKRSEDTTQGRSDSRRKAPFKWPTTEKHWVESFAPLDKVNPEDLSHEDIHK